MTTNAPRWQAEPLLADKVAVISGASRGIGAAIAEHYAAAGARLVLAARKPEGLQATAQRLSERGVEVLAHPCHMGHPEQVDALIAAAVARFGRVDVLVNNAATNPYFGPMLNLTWEAWDKTFEVNLKGYFAASRAVARHLIDRRAPGAIINVTSVLGMMAALAQGMYGMTKAAVISMTKTLAAELGSAGIRVNAIAPGLIDTRFSAAMVQNEGIKGPILARTALGRVGQPDDVGGAAVFLASDAAAFVTGQTLVVDGGWTI